ncbi:uncharacterized protein EI90DRAFT_3027798 [Cantharellus anzutake]|uniref:uncharacterized protein n=1 Tax=Cantharellus anzutake TaxID=1750568 RepID=UPI00190758A3|nr:uncharacterized protein EI90DRAFT_3027798 [Cantharellus anzutake]KAF8343990.1 hypothetical protein EI90DRAFT_3027798 [Cantharellus anzutake]
MSAKGKQRAESKVGDGRLYEYDQDHGDPSESTSLLAPSSTTVVNEYGTGSASGNNNSRSYSGRRRTWVRALVWFLSFLSLSLFFFIIIVLFLFSSFDRAPAARRAPAELLAHGIRWETSSVSLDNVTGGDVDITVHGVLGFDTDWILGVDTDASVLAPLRRSLTRWAIGHIGDLKVAPTTASLYGRLGKVDVLIANVSTREEATISVVPTKRGGIVHMQDVHIPLRIRSPNNSMSVLKWSNRTWTEGKANIRVYLPEATVSAARSAWWLPNFSRKEHDINASAKFKLPQTPDGFPSPGEPFALSKVFTLVNYSMGILNSKHGAHEIGFSALASLLLPLTQSTLLKLNLPSDLPQFRFQVSLINGEGGVNRTVPFVLLSTSPELDNGTSDSELASVNFPVKGSLLPLLPSTVPPLSRLVSNYLSAQSSIIILSSAPLAKGKSLISLPPTPITIPGPSKRPKILKNITVKNMHLSPSKSGDTLVASGTLFATYGLPTAMQDLTPLIDIRKVWPDTLIFNGEVPPDTFRDDNEGSGRIMTPGENPLPDPLPERAFARILPEDWIPAHEVPPENAADILNRNEASSKWMDMQGGVVTGVVTAEIVDVPLQILPGRDAEFQAFVRKIMLSRGAGVPAGVKGTAAIGIRVEGLTLPRSAFSRPDEDDDQQDIELEGLTFEGNVTVGKKNSWR